MARIPPMPYKQYVLEDLVLVAVVLLCAAKETDGVGYPDGVEVRLDTGTEGTAEDVTDFVAARGGVVDCREGEAEEGTVGGDDLMVGCARGHLSRRGVKRRGQGEVNWLG